MELLQEAIMKASTAKLNLWHRAEKLSDLLGQFGKALAGTWQLDDAVRACNQCGNAFSFTVRKHHCR